MLIYDIHQGYSLVQDFIYDVSQSTTENAIHNVCMRGKVGII